MKIKLKNDHTITPSLAGSKLIRASKGETIILDVQGGYITTKNVSARIPMYQVDEIMKKETGE